MSDYDPNSARWGQAAAPSRASIDQGLRSYMIGVYNNMMLGLGMTGVVAFLTNQLTVVRGSDGAIEGLTQLGQTLYTSNFKYVVIFAPLAFVMFVQYQFNNWSSSALRAGFFAYAAMLGVSLSVLLIIYSGTSVANAFFITATAFGACSLYGYTTKRDLSAVGSFCLMGLWGAILASLVGIFLHSSALQIGISVVIVLASAGMQAYSNQEVKQFYYDGGGQETLAKKSILGALWMYINFVNMFTSILRLTGGRN